jgi:hypothetical protein
MTSLPIYLFRTALAYLFIAVWLIATAPMAEHALSLIAGSLSGVSPRSIFVLAEFLE